MICCFLYRFTNFHLLTHSRQLYYIPHFGSAHLPYAILAIAVLVMLVLLLYPFRCFQKLLNALPVRWHIL